MLEFTLSSLLAAYMVFFGVREIQTDAVNVVFYATSCLPRKIYNAARRHAFINLALSKRQ
jgi:hypothetical protein